MFVEADSLNWWDYAACRGMDVNIFFPTRGQSQAEAKATCKKCPVTRFCGTYAELNHEMGLWNGTIRKRGSGPDDYDDDADPGDEDYAPTPDSPPDHNHHHPANVESFSGVDETECQ